MTTAQVVETSVTVNNNSPIQDYVHQDDQTQPTFEVTHWVQTFHSEYNYIQAPFNRDHYKQVRHQLQQNVQYVQLKIICHNSSLAAPQYH